MTRVLSPSSPPLSTLSELLLRQLLHLPQFTCSISPFASACVRPSSNANMMSLFTCDLCQGSCSNALWGAVSMLPHVSHGVIYRQQFAHACCRSRRSQPELNSKGVFWPLCCISANRFKVKPRIHQVLYERQKLYR